MRTIGMAAAAVLLAAGANTTVAGTVQQAHEHGTGTLNIAVEGATVEIELIAPGADIVGFEHSPASDADRQAVQEAAATLRDGTGLFVFPEAAGCALAHASVSSALLGEQDRHPDEAHAEDAHGEDAHADEAEAHAEFLARYRFECENPDGIGTLELRYFELLPNARELDANVLSETGQTAAELTPDDARLEL